MTLITLILEGLFRLLFDYWGWVPIALILIYRIWQNSRRKQFVAGHDALVLSVEVPKNSEKGPVAAEMMFAALHGVLTPKDELTKGGKLQEYFAFEIESRLNSIRFYVWTPKRLKEFVEAQIYSQYPTAEIHEAEDYTKIADTHSELLKQFAGTEIVLQKEDYFPIKSFQDFEVDPLAGITGVLSKMKEGELAWIQILTRPVDDSWHKRGLSYVEALKEGKVGKGIDFSVHGFLNFTHKAIFQLGGALLDMVTNPPSPDKKKDAKGGKKEEPKLTTTEQTVNKGIEEKAAKLGYQVKIRVLYFAPMVEAARSEVMSIASAFKQFNTTTMNGFVSGKTTSSPDLLDEYRARAFYDEGYVLNVAELASVFHLPYESVQTPNIVWTSSKKGEPPSNLPIRGSVPDDELSLFAQTNYRNAQVTFGIKRVDRPRHAYVIGKSGMGKSELLKLLMLSDIYHDKGFALIDPHGDLADDIMKYIPESRVDDVIVFDPSDREFPIGFNILEVTDPDLKYHVASGFVSIFKKMFGFSWGPRLEHIMRYTVLALLDYPNATMLGVTRMLVDKNFRKKVRKQIQDVAVKKFWQDEFESWNERFASEAVAPVLNKVGQFVATPVLRNIIGQPNSTIDLWDIMNNGKILIVNLKKIGDDNKALIGAMLITQFQLTAMRRAHIKPEDRRDFYLYVDEFQHFATDAFASILSEARKYKLNLTVANQYIAQMPEEVREAVFGNVGSMITFRVGPTDASFLEKEFTPIFTAEDLVYLGVQHVYVKLAIDGQTSAPFSAITLQTPAATEDHTAEIIARSRQKYAKTQAEVEESITRWAGMLDREAAEAEAEDEAERATNPPPREPARWSKYPPRRQGGGGYSGAGGSGAQGKPPQRRSEQTRRDQQPRPRPPERVVYSASADNKPRNESTSPQTPRPQAPAAPQPPKEQPARPETPTTQSQSVPTEEKPQGEMKPGETISLRKE